MFFSRAFALALLGQAAMAQNDDAVGTLFETAAEHSPFLQTASGTIRQDIHVELSGIQYTILSRQPSQNGRLRCILILDRGEELGRKVAYRDDRCDGTIDAMDFGDGSRSGFDGPQSATFETIYRDNIDRLTAFMAETRSIGATPLPVPPKEIVPRTRAMLIDMADITRMLDTNWKTTGRPFVRMRGAPQPSGRRSAWIFDFDGTTPTPTDCRIGRSLEVTTLYRDANCDGAFEEVRLDDGAWVRADPASIDETHEITLEALTAMKAFGRNFGRATNLLPPG